MRGLKALRKQWQKLISQVQRLWVSVRTMGAFLVLAYSPIETWARRAEASVAFQPSGNSSRSAIQSDDLRSRIWEVQFPTTGGLKLHGWHIPAHDGKPTVIFSHNNYDTMDRSEALMAAFVNRGYGFFAYDYRGYGRSQGVPTEAGIYQDLEKASDFLRDVLQVPVKEQVAVGESIGGAVTVDVATRRPFKAVMLLSAFPSHADTITLAKKKWGLPERWIPAEAKVKTRLASAEKIHQLQSPLLVVHGSRDPLVSTELSKKLFDHAPNHLQKNWMLIEGGGHCRLMSRAGRDILDALERMIR